MSAEQVCLTGPAGVELDGGAGPVHHEVGDGGLGCVAVVEHDPTDTHLL